MAAANIILKFTDLQGQSHVLEYKSSSYKSDSMKSVRDNDAFTDECIFSLDVKEFTIPFPVEEKVVKAYAEHFKYGFLREKYANGTVYHDSIIEAMADTSFYKLVMFFRPTSGFLSSFVEELLEKKEIIPKHLYSSFLKPVYLSQYFHEYVHLVDDVGKEWYVESCKRTQLSGPATERLISFLKDSPQIAREYIDQHGVGMFKVSGKVKKYVTGKNYDELVANLVQMCQFRGYCFYCSRSITNKSRCCEKGPK